MIDLPLNQLNNVAQRAPGAWSLAHERFSTLFPGIWISSLCASEGHLKTRNFNRKVKHQLRWKDDVHKIKLYNLIEIVES